MSRACGYWSRSDNHSRENSASYRCYNNIKLIGANGSPISSSGFSPVSIGLMEQEITWFTNVIIVPDINYDIILGCDFIHAFDLLVDTPRQKLLMRNGTECGTFHVDNERRKAVNAINVVESINNNCDNATAVNLVSISQVSDCNSEASLLLDAYRKREEVGEENFTETIRVSAR